MYILLLSRGYSPKKFQIWGNFEMQQARILQNAGHKVIVACVDDRLAGNDRFLYFFQKPGFRKQTINGLPVYSCFFIPHRFAELFGFNSYTRIYEWQYAGLLKRIVKDFGIPDVIYSHYLNVNYFASILKLQFNIPVVGVEHWSEVNKVNIAPRIKKMADLTYSRLDSLICVSKPFADKIYARFRIKAEVINNMVDIEFSLSKKKCNDDGIVRIVTVGRLRRPKQFDNILKAIKKANLPNNSWQFNIVGGGPMMSSLKKLTSELKLSDNVRFTGMKNTNELHQILSESDFFVLASEHETFGVVFIEAMSFGLPIIGTKCGGPESIINSNNGLLVENNNIDALADAIKTMMIQYKSYSGESIINEVKRIYSPAVIVPQIMKVLNNAINEYGKKL